MRNITVVNSSLNKKKTVESSSTSWGELKPELSEAGLLRGDVRGVIKETSTSLDLDAASLPEGEFTLFIIPKKSKAGSEDYATWSFAQLRAECAHRDDVQGESGNYGSTEVMIKKLRDSDERNAPKGQTNAPVDQSALETVVLRLEALADRLEAIAEGTALGELNTDDVEEEEEDDTPSEEDLEFAKQAARQI